MPNNIELILACVSVVTALLAGIQYIINSTIDRKLALFEVSLTKRINGTYVKTPEFESFMDQRREEREHMYHLLQELKEGLEYLRRKQEESNHRSGR